MTISSNKRLLATGAAAIAEALAWTRPVYLVCVKLHLSAAGGAAENFTVSTDSATNAVYDTILFSQDMNTVQDLMWLPDRPIPVLGGDEVDIAYNNGNARTYGLEVIYKTED